MAEVWPHERRTHACFPEFPPYDDAFTEPVPHLTIAEVGPGELG